MNVVRLSWLSLVLLLANVRSRSVPPASTSSPSEPRLDLETSSSSRLRGEDSWKNRDEEEEEEEAEKDAKEDTRSRNEAKSRWLQYIEQMEENSTVHNTNSSTNDSFQDQILGVIDGDIILTKETAEVFFGYTSKEMRGEEKEGNGRGSRAVTSLKDHLWENATVPYVFDENFPRSRIRVAQNAMKHWQRKTCIRFVPRMDEPYYLRFILDNSDCATFIGRQTYIARLPGYNGQSMKLSAACAKHKGTIIHELGHTIGFWHEVSRRDRDQYIEVLWQNIPEGIQNNFVIKEEQVDDLGVPYDLISIMHYQLNSFSSSEDLNTIRVLEANYSKISQVGQRSHLSELDRRQANLLYSCQVGTRVPQEDVSAALELYKSFKTGCQIALQLVSYSDRVFWMGCNNERCALGGCPGSTFKDHKREDCQDFIFTIHRADGQNSLIHVGDRVILKHGPEPASQNMLRCYTNDTCASAPYCQDSQGGGFDEQVCRNQIFEVTVPNKTTGSVLKDRDMLVLKYNGTGAALIDEAIHCSLTKKKKECQRLESGSCDGISDCQYRKTFRAFKLT